MMRQIIFKHLYNSRIELEWLARTLVWWAIFHWIFYPWWGKSGEVAGSDAVLVLLLAFTGTIIPRLYRIPGRK